MGVYSINLSHDAKYMGVGCGFRLTKFVGLHIRYSGFELVQLGVVSSSSSWTCWPDTTSTARSRRPTLRRKTPWKLYTIRRGIMRSSATHN